MIAPSAEDVCLSSNTPEVMNLIERGGQAELMAGFFFTSPSSEFRSCVKVEVAVLGSRP